MMKEIKGFKTLNISLREMFKVLNPLISFFSDIWIFIGYLMLKPSLEKNSRGTI